ncbi:hypothetical protein EVAR_29196_1 [Eumeta japonica]|uniref:Uncharacterized protein n=1 Tax=Eumeta variegata TaxID=151549 RepID=A0A4C1VEK1_EUMVA|nr:hypothetical protein EVAR_29196_1 [Eumeta japonica]
MSIGARIGIKSGAGTEIESRDNIGTVVDRVLSWVWVACEASGVHAQSREYGLGSILCFELHSNLTIEAEIGEQENMEERVDEDSRPSAKASIEMEVESEWNKWEKNFCDTFANKGWSPIRYALAFKYQTGSLLDYALKKEKLLLEVRKSIDTGTLIDLIALGLPNYLTDKIDRETLQETEDLYNELGDCNILLEGINVKTPNVLDDRRNKDVSSYSDVSKQDINRCEVNFNEHINLDEFEIVVDHLDLHQQAEIDTLLRKYKSVFAKDKYDVGTVRDYEAHIDLMLALSRPFFRGPRKLPPADDRRERPAITSASRAFVTSPRDDRVMGVRTPLWKKLWASRA